MRLNLHKRRHATLCKGDDAFRRVRPHIISSVHTNSVHFFSFIVAVGCSVSKCVFSLLSPVCLRLVAIEIFLSLLFFFFLKSPSKINVNKCQTNKTFSTFSDVITLRQKKSLVIDKFGWPVVVVAASLVIVVVSVGFLSFIYEYLSQQFTDIWRAIQTVFADSFPHECFAFRKFEQISMKSQTP